MEAVAYNDEQINFLFFFQKLFPAIKSQAGVLSSLGPICLHSRALSER